MSPSQNRLDIIVVDRQYTLYKSRFSKKIFIRKLKKFNNIYETDIGKSM